MPAKLAARVRVFSTGNGRKTDPVDAHSVALAALRADRLNEVRGDDAMVALTLPLQIQRDWPNPGSQLFGHVTSRTRRTPRYARRDPGVLTQRGATTRRSGIARRQLS